MPWWQFALLGAAGGALVEALGIFRWLSVWQAERRTEAGRVMGEPPSLRSYVDVPVHVWLTVLRASLGAAVAALFGANGQISGVYVAVVLGFSAPSVLAQLGTVRPISDAVAGEDSDGR